MMKEILELYNNMGISPTVNHYGEKALEKLSAFEYEVMSYYVGGYKIREISEILSVSPKSVDNAVRRFKQKLRNDGQN